MVRTDMSKRSVYIALAMTAVFLFALVMSSAIVGAGDRVSDHSGEWTIVSNGATEGGYLLNTKTGELWLVRQDTKTLVTGKK